MSFIPTAYAATTAAAESGALDFAAIIGKIIIACILIAVTFIMAIGLKKWVQYAIRKKQGDQHEQLVILYGRIAFTSVLIAGVLMALIVTGMPLEMFSGALGLGLAFAFKSPVANFIAGIALLTQDKYNLGDFIAIGEAKGTIVDITSRATSLRGIEGTEITVPNIDLLTQQVTCFTRNPIRRREITVGVGYKTNLRTASDIILNTIKKHHAVEPEPAPVVVVDTIGDSAVILKCRFWVASKSRWVVTQSELTQQIFEDIQAAGIDIPYPVQTLRVDTASSDILAQQPHMLDHLQAIEKNKEQVFQAMPTETVPTPVTTAQDNSQPATISH